MNILHIAGHGLKRNKTFDPGASGYIKQGEHKYYAESFFGLLKKYEPKGHNVKYHTSYNVYDYGDIVKLANSVGSKTVVIEWHFDASSSSEPKGGHVIVYKGFKPDALDLRLRNGIKEMVGIRNSHLGYEGISGRDNLGNVNRCANGGINYRLIELGFGTNKEDSTIMLNDIDKFAKVMSEKIYDTKIEIEPQKDSKAGYHVVLKGETLWGIGQKYNVTVAEIKAKNNLKSDLIFPGQSLEVIGSDHPEPKPELKPTVTPVAEIKNEIKKGNWVRVPAKRLYTTGNSNNPTNSKELSAQIESINYNWKNPIRLIKNNVYVGFTRIADIKGTEKVSQVDITKLAIEIINQPKKWGVGNQRRANVEAAGYNYNEVQKKVNELMYNK